MGYDIRNNLAFIALLILCLFPLYTYGMVSTALGLFLVLAVLSHYVSSEKDKEINRFELFLEILFYLFLCSSIIYSKNKSEGATLLLRLSPLILFPIFLRALRYNRIDNKQYSKVRGLYISANVVLGLYVLIKAIIVQLETGTKFYNSLKIIAQNSSIWELHPTYLGIFMLMAFFLLIESLSQSKNNIEKLRSTLLAIFLAIIILLLSSRIVLLCMVLGSLIYFRNKKGKLLFLFAFILSISILIIYVKPLQFQINELLNTELVLPTEKFPSTVKVRYAINYCSMNTIKANILFGVGIGDFQNELAKCYDSLETEALTRHNYNSHNFYFFLWGSSGIFAVLAFISLLIIKLKNSIKRHEKTQIIFWVIIIGVNLTESFLSRSFGITFFIFFFSLFYLKNNYDNGFYNNPSLQR